MNYLVRNAMKAAGFYPENESEDEMKSKFYPKATVILGGKSYDLAAIAHWDALVYADEMDSMLCRQNPIIHDLFAVNALTMFNAIRMVNINSKQGFKGQMASGNELDLTLFRPQQFYDPDNTGVVRTTWERTIASTGAKYFFEGALGSCELEMGEEEAMVWLGWYNPALDPCSNAYQITMNTSPYDIQSMDFDMANEQMGDPIVPFKEPWTLPPEQSAYVQAYYFKTGNDALRPLGIWIKMSRNLRALATS